MREKNKNDTPTTSFWSFEEVMNATLFVALGHSNSISHTQTHAQCVSFQREGSGKRAQIWSNHCQICYGATKIQRFNLWQ